MFSVEAQQIEICLLKTDLQEIEEKLVTQYSALPVLDDENKRKYEETMAVLQMVRSSNSAIENCKKENMSLSVKREQLKRQCHELSENLETARKNRNDLDEALKKENTEIEREILQYEKSLQEKAERFRTTRRYYDEAEINKELESIKNDTSGLEIELSNKQNAFDVLKSQVDNIHPEVPKNIVDICGKPDLDDKIKTFTTKLEGIIAERKATF